MAGVFESAGKRASTSPLVSSSSPSMACPVAPGLGASHRGAAAYSTQSADAPTNKGRSIHATSPSKFPPAPASPAPATGVTCTQSARTATNVWTLSGVLGDQFLPGAMRAPRHCSIALGRRDGKNPRDHTSERPRRCAPLCIPATTSEGCLGRDLCIVKRKEGVRPPARPGGAASRWTG